ncbi:MAG: type II secretion system protein [Candidatus Kaiserbacteria bacterium]|nr:type II secretion system protein [Candidatus Kaiserbacteria bacterium]
MRQTGGFTLIELMVAVSLVSVVIISLLTIFTSFIQQQIFSQSERNALNSIRFLIADMSRDISFGTDYACGGKTGNTCVCITLTDQLNRRVKIRYNGVENRVEKSVQVVDANPSRCLSGDPWTPLTDTAVDIAGLSFVINSSADPSHVKMTVRASYTVDGKKKSIEFPTQVTRRVFRPDEGVLSLLRVGSGDDQGGASLSYFIYNDSGNCVDDSGATVRAKQCQNTANPIAAEITNQGLYILAENGLLYHLPISTVRTIFSATAASGSITEKLVPISTIQSSVTRVVGKKNSDTCRGCLNDPVNIETIYPAGSRLYAVDRDGSLYKVDGTSAEVILNSNSGDNQIHQFDSNNGDGSVFALYTQGGSKKLRIFNTEDIGASDLSGSCSAFAPRRNDRCRQIIPASGTYRHGLSGLNNLSLSQISRIQLSADYTLIWYQTGSAMRLFVIGDRVSWEYEFTGAERSTQSIARDIVKGLAEARPQGTAGLSKQFIYFPCKDGKKFCSVFKYPIVPRALTFAIEKTVTKKGGGVNNEDSLIRFSYLVGEKGRYAYDINAIGLSDRGRMVFFALTRGGANRPVATVYEKNKRLLCGTTVRDVGSVKQQAQLFFLSKQPPSINNLDKALVLLGRSINQSSGSISEVYLLTESGSNRAGYAYGTTGTLCGSDHVERYRIPASGLSYDILRLTGLQLVDKAPTP